MSHLDQLLASKMRELQESRLAKNPAEVKPKHPDFKPKLTIGIATYNDFDGAYFTVTSLLAYHSEAMQECEVVILDNHPNGIEAKSLANLAQEYADQHVRYVPYTDVQSTAVRDVLFSFARGEWVLVLDSHVQLLPGALQALLQYIDKNPNSKNILSGPIVNATGVITGTQFDPKWSSAMFGVWGIDERANDIDSDPFEIPSMGLALFAMAKKHWVGINPRFRGFGGEEGYVHEKVRQAGGKALCLPALRWHHRFARPNGAPYQPKYLDRINNYLLGWREIGYDLRSMHEHLSEVLHPENYFNDLRTAERRLDHPSAAFDVLLVASNDDLIAPWRKVLANSEKQYIEAERLAIADSASTDDLWEKALFLATEKAQIRRWKTALVLAENTEAEYIYSHIAKLLQQLYPDKPLTLTSANGTVLAQTLFFNPRKPQKFDAVKLKHQSKVIDISQWLQNTVNPGSVIEGYTFTQPNSADLWLRTYNLWAHYCGLGSTMHRAIVAAFDSFEVQNLRAWATHVHKFVANAQDASSTKNSLLLAENGLLINEDSYPILTRTLGELKEHKWAICAVSQNAAPATEDQLFIGSADINDTAAVLVSKEFAELLAKLLPEKLDSAQAEKILEQYGSLSSLLSQTAEKHKLKIFAPTTQLIARESALYFDNRITGAGRLRDKIIKND